MRRENVDCWEQRVRDRDRLLTVCYGVGLVLAAACLFLPYRLSQLGAGLLLVALTHNSLRVRAAHRVRTPADSPWAHPRLMLAQSMLFNVPFLVGANLVFMGLPLGRDRVQEAILDCWFLAGTVALLAWGYWWNQRVGRALKFCVVGRAVPPSRSE